MSATLDLNADLGEGVGDDEAMLEIVSSANVACGGHAGDEASMRAALRAAKARGVVVGAHPSFPDRVNFGRTRMVRKPSASATSDCAELSIARIAIPATNPSTAAKQSAATAGSSAAMLASAPWSFT